MGSVDKVTVVAGCDFEWKCLQIGVQKRADRSNQVGPHKVEMAMKCIDKGTCGGLTVLKKKKEEGGGTLVKGFSA